MKLGPRLALAFVIVIVDFVSFIIPLGSLTIAWVIVTRPQWAIDFIDRLYADDDPGTPGDAPKAPPDAINASDANNASDASTAPPAADTDKARGATPA